MLDHLAEHQQIIPLANTLRIRIESITADMLLRGAALSPQHRLLTNDALTLAVMEKLSVNQLATNDDDFDSISGLIISKPTRK